MERVGNEKLDKNLSAVGSICLILGPSAYFAFFVVHPDFGIGPPVIGPQPDCLVGVASLAAIPFSSLSQQRPWRACFVSAATILAFEGFWSITYTPLYYAEYDKSAFTRFAFESGLLLWLQLCAIICLTYVYCRLFAIVVEWRKSR